MSRREGAEGNARGALLPNAFHEFFAMQRNTDAGRTEFTPAYLRLPSGGLAGKVRKAGEILRSCTLCPRECRVDRTAGALGVCRTGDRPFVSSWGPHFGEERPLTGTRGSGTIFFGRCNLLCVFCQNYTISHLGEGAETSFERLGGIMLELQSLGCHNINLVTPTHQMPMILRSLLLASEAGLTLPLVYNCGGYESLDAIRLLEGVVDIYMPDFKYGDPAPAIAFSRAKDYPSVARSVIKEMHRQVGDLVMSSEGTALRGLLVRHLVLPENAAGTAEVVRFLAAEISKDTYLNIMDQYRPCFHAHLHPPLGRSVTAREFGEAVALALKAGLRRLDGISMR